MNLIRQKGVPIAAVILLFVFFWTAVLIVVPQLYMFDYSFRNFDLDTASAGNERGIQNYRYLFSSSYESWSGFNALHLNVFFRTIVSAVAVTLLNLMLSYPVAYLMGQVFRGVALRVLVVGLICPFWINEILRAFSFRLLFGNEGIVNDLLLFFGFYDVPVDFVNSDVALYVGLVYAYLLLMIFPIFNSVESLDHNQVEASRDLGAPWWKTHWRVIIPHAKPGIASGCIMVFMLLAGTLATPQILGGTSSLWFTQVVERWMNASGNWPMGAAYSFALLFTCTLFVLAVLKITKVDLGGGFTR